jgi:hypothetical protein
MNMCRLLASRERTVVYSWKREKLLLRGHNAQLFTVKAEGKPNLLCNVNTKRNAHSTTSLDKRGRTIFLNVWTKE